jgi:putative endonuclease
MNTYYVYILSTKNNKLVYVWVTNNLERRLYEHKNKLVEWFTSKYNINKLVYYEEITSIENAINREKQIKWRLRLKKNELIESINPNREDLWSKRFG